ncbi:MAG: heavy-metal-associated domain-containing protein [bacterium]|nr:heavy-metal-associated domain-containing protein [bacterium]
MKTLKFKSNIKCGGCIATVTPFLNAKEGISKWDVDLASPDKILSIDTANLNSEEIIEVLKNAGYKAELISN